MNSPCHFCPSTSSAQLHSAPDSTPNSTKNRLVVPMRLKICAGSRPRRSASAPGSRTRRSRACSRRAPGWSADRAPGRPSAPRPAPRAAARSGPGADSTRPAAAGVRGVARCAGPAARGQTVPRTVLRRANTAIRFLLLRGTGAVSREPNGPVLAGRVIWCRTLFKGNRGNVRERGGSSNQLGNRSSGFPVPPRREARGANRRRGPHAGLESACGRPGRSRVRWSSSPRAGSISSCRYTGRLIPQRLVGSGSGPRSPGWRLRTAPPSRQASTSSTLVMPVTRSALMTTSRLSPRPSTRTRIAVPR